MQQTITVQTLSQLSSFIKTLLRLLGATFFLSICAQVSIPLPFSPVPLSMQTLGVLLVGATMGSHLGTAAVLLYLMEGAIGLPVFAGGSAGMLVLLGPKGGYLIGFLAAAYLSGKATNFTGIRLLLSLVLANLSIYLFGLLQLSLFVGQAHLLMMGFYPFLIGDLLKVMLVSSWLSRAR